MLGSLEKLASYLKPSDKIQTLTYIQNRFPHLSTAECDAITKKGIFPYSYFDTTAKLALPGLPPIETFTNDLTDEPCDPIAYAEAAELFAKLKFETFGEWLQLYQALDIKLLMDVWIQFRDSCLETYELEPAHYYTSPGVAYDAMLKKTKIQLELIRDPTMYYFFEAQIRGGVSTTGNVRHAIANSPTVPSTYDPTERVNQILYLDANNLYGHSMCQNLPTHGFKWMTQDAIAKTLTEEFIRNYPDGEDGYVLEVDLDYPEAIHDAHNAFPLAVEKRAVTTAELSPYNANILESMARKDGVKITMGQSEKLVPNLNDKKNYVLHIRNLQCYLRQGLALAKIHRAVVFKQSKFIEPYIMMNTTLRQKAVAEGNEFRKDFYKLMNNSVFGKTMENVRKRGNFELVYSAKRIQKIIANRWYKNIIPISPSLALLERYPKQVKLCKPIQIGAQILDLSKIVVIDFYYNHVMREFANVNLIATDTDSLMLQLSPKPDSSESIYETIWRLRHLYDLSNTKKGNGMYAVAEKFCRENNLDLKTELGRGDSIPGLMKNETPNSEITEFVSIKAKQYAFTTSESKEKKICKGVRRNVIAKDLHFDDYKKCILDAQIKRVTQKGIKSYNHEIYTVAETKLALQPFNDKRYILEDGVSSLAYGHYSLPKVSPNEPAEEAYEYADEVQTEERDVEIDMADMMDN